MSEMIFDFGGLVASSAAAPSSPPASARPNGRFEEHLGQAARPPRESSAERTPATADESRPVSTQAQQSNGDARPAQTANDAADDAPRKADQTANDRTDGDVSGDDSPAIAPAGANPSLPRKVTGGRRGEADEAQADGLEAKGGKPKPKPHRGRPSINEKGGAQPTNEKLVPPRPSANQDPIKVKVDDRTPAEQSLDESGPVASTENTLTVGDQNADENQSPGLTLGEKVAASITATAGDAASHAAAANAHEKVTPTTANADVAITAASPQAQQPERSDGANGGKRTRGAKGADTAATTAIQRAASEADAESATAGTAAAAAKATPDNATIVEATTQSDQPPVDATGPTHDKTAEPRQTAVPGLLAARHERTSEGTGRGEGLTEAERVRFVQRIAKAFHSLGDEGGEVRLRLSPPELGSLRLELSVREGVLAAHLETETAAARNLLLDHLPMLRDRLAEQNIKVERFDVDVRDEHQQPAGEQFAGQNDLPRNSERQRQRYSAQPRATPERAIRGTIARDGAGELNIVI